MHYPRTVLADNLQNNFQAHWQVGDVVCWDELVWGTNTRSNYRVYVPHKPHPNGLLFHEETSVGIHSGLPYLYDFLPYVDTTRATPLDVAKHFTRSLPQQTHIVGDAWFPAANVLTYLDSSNMYYTFSCPVTRLFFLWRFLDHQIQYRDYRVLQHTALNYVAVSYHDNKKVHFLSNGWVQDLTRIGCPTTPPLLNFYKTHFNACDIFNRYAYYQRFRHRYRKWTDVLLFVYLKMAITNAWILYNESNLCDSEFVGYMEKLHKKLLQKGLSI
jgi:hypothetical protein